MISVFSFSVAVLADSIVPPYQDPGQQTQSAPQSGAFSELDTQLGAAAGQKGAGLGTPQDPRSVAAGIIRVVLNTLGIIFLGLTVYGGFLWMTAAGNEETVGKAKKTIYYAVTGLVIVLAAYSITYFAFRVALQGYTPSSGLRLQGPDPFQSNKDPFR